MTYAEFLLWFLVVPSLVMMGVAGWLGKTGKFSEVDSQRHWRGIGILAVIAFVWTTPWDNYLIARGVWDSPPDRILGRIGYVPVEEYAFFVLMPVFNGALIHFLLPCFPVASATSKLKQPRQRLIATMIAAVLLVCGVYALRFESGTYLGLILVWFTPPLLIQWLFDPGALLRGKHIIFWGTFLPSVYFAVVDHYAISSGIWAISEQRTTGFGLPGLPFEEMFFFATTSLLLAQGLVLWHSLRQPDSDR